MKAEIKVTLKMDAKELLLLVNFLGGQSRQSIATALGVSMDHEDALAMRDLNGYLYGVLSDLKG